MHEVGICEAILQIVEKRSNGRQVMRVSVVAGVNHHLDPEAMQQGFSLVASGGPAENASLDLEIVPSNATCDGCQATFEVVNFFSACPECGSPSTTVQENDALYVKSIEYALSLGDVAWETRQVS